MKKLTYKLQATYALVRNSYNYHEGYVCVFERERERERERGGREGGRERERERERESIERGMERERERDLLDHSNRGSR